VDEKEIFQKYIDSISNPTGKRPRRHFRIPEELRDVFSKPYSAPTEELVRNEIVALMEEYEKFDLSEFHLLSLLLFGMLNISRFGSVSELLFGFSSTTMLLIVVLISNRL